MLVKDQTYSASPEQRKFNVSTHDSCAATTMTASTNGLRPAKGEHHIHITLPDGKTARATVVYLERIALLMQWCCRKILCQPTSA